MINILLAVLFSISVSILLKHASRKGLDLLQMIGFNYVSALVMGHFFFNERLLEWLHFEGDWQSSLLPLVLLGILLPAIFAALGQSVRYAGIGLTEGAQRLSLIIPILLSVTLFGEVLNSQRIASLGLAFTALFLIIAGRCREGAPTEQKRAVFSLLAVWAGFGVIDALFKQLARSSVGQDSTGVMVSFLLAMMFVLIWVLLSRRRFSAPSALWGLGMGLLNFANIHFYIKAHQDLPDSPSVVFTGMNMGVLAAGVLAGMLIFREKPNLLSALGLGAAAASILCLIL